MVHNSYTMCIRGLPNMYTRPQARGLRVHISANHSCPWYNYNMYIAILVLYMHAHIRNMHTVD